MERCPCGSPIRFPFDELGCIACGQACCSTCGVSLESVTYCWACASAFLEVPSRSVRGRPAAA